nr:MAG TPA: hypothetical protein [Caudoviricetes sp.]
MYHRSSCLAMAVIFILKIKEVQYGKSKIYPI